MLITLLWCRGLPWTTVDGTETGGKLLLSRLRPDPKSSAHERLLLPRSLGSPLIVHSATSSCPYRDLFSSPVSGVVQRCPWKKRGQVARDQERA
ncbi:hypothetical protein F4780DRAFT_436074 [Xylariomycetidae sp. FL0641]|nr:hypothetical protein F4780DRAFT_436074 [Xylariomycetidae sp. FL0641]